MKETWNTAEPHKNSGNLEAQETANLMKAYLAKAGIKEDEIDKHAYDQALEAVARVKEAAQKEKPKHVAQIVAREILSTLTYPPAYAVIFATACLDYSFIGSWARWASAAPSDYFALRSMRNSIRETLENMRKGLTPEESELTKLRKIAEGQVEDEREAFRKENLDQAT